MERSNPEFPSADSQELNEQAQEKLIALKGLLTELYDSLSKKDGEINSIYTEIIKLQKLGKRNQLYLGLKKNELITACVQHRTPLLQAASALPSEIQNYFKRDNINLLNLPNQLLIDVGSLKDQELTENPTENRFRISVWMNEISVIINVINTLLVKKDNA